MEPATKMYGRLVQFSQAATEGQNITGDQPTVPEALDTMVKWFCISASCVMFIARDESEKT